jgi:hypothetical protein
MRGRRLPGSSAEVPNCEKVAGAFASTEFCLKLRFRLRPSLRLIYCCADAGLPDGFSTRSPIRRNVAHMRRTRNS